MAKPLVGWQHRSASLGTYQAAVDATLAEMAENQVIHRIWAHDHTVWKPEPTEITNRLGWLHTAEVMGENLYRLEELIKAVRAGDHGGRPYVSEARRAPTDKSPRATTTLHWQMGLASQEAAGLGVSRQRRVVRSCQIKMH